MYEIFYFQNKRWNGGQFFAKIFFSNFKSLLNPSGMAFPSSFKYFAVTAIAITVVPVAAMIWK